MHKQQFLLQRYRKEHAKTENLIYLIDLLVLL